MFRTFCFFQLKFFLYCNQNYKEKWVISCPYDPHNVNIFRLLGKITGTLDIHFSEYGNILLRYFNVNVDKETMKNLCTSRGLPDLIKIPTCFSNSE